MNELCDGIYLDKLIKGNKCDTSQCVPNSYY